MSSLSNTQINTRSMNGLVDIQANSGTFDEIDCNTLNVNLSATAPTVSSLSNDNNIATTAWVTNHAGGAYVTLNTAQNITGEKTFSNANTYINNTLTADTITAIGDLTLNPVGSINCNGKTIDMTGGEIHKCPLIHSQNNNNIVVEGLGTGDVILKTNGINRVTVADSGITTFSTLPECPVVPTTGDQLVNKTFTDSTYVALTGAQTVAGIKTFSSLPECSTSASTGNQLTNKTYVDGAISGGSFVTTNTTQTVSGEKTFSATTTYISGDLVMGSGGSGKNIVCENITATSSNNGNLYSTQNLGTVNIATSTNRSGAINIGTGTVGKTITIGGTADTQVLNSNTLTIYTGTSTSNGITHSSTATSGDDMRLTATGGYIARLGEGSSTAGLTLLGVDSGTSIIRATTSSLQIRADAGISLTGDITSSNTYTGTNTLTGITQFNNNLRVASTSTIRLGTASTGTLIGQTFTNEVTAQNINASDKFIFRTSTSADIISFADSGILVSSATSFLNDTNINQATYTSMGTTQLGYTIQKTFATTVLSDTTGTFSVVGTGQAIGTNKGVYLITCGFELTNSGSDTMNNKAICLSLTSGSGTPVNAFGAWEYYDEINDSMGAGGTRFIGTLCGVYIKTTTSAQSLFLNGYANTTGSATISATGNCSITRIG